MASVQNIRALYQATRNISGSHGIQGYHVDKKYVDAAKLKQQKQFASKSRSKTKPINVSEKKTFIDQVQKKSARLPGPTSYEPKELQSQSKTQARIFPGNRLTIFDQIGHYHKKYNFPSSDKYSKVQSQVDKSKLKGNMSKAQNSNFLQSKMRGSLQGPGVGSYNAHHKLYEEGRGNKWVQSKVKSKSTANTKLPPVGTYDPQPVSFGLFSSINSLNKNRSKSNLGRQERFKTSKKKDIPYYNVLSQWGMKDKNHKKDILSKVSRTVGHSSVYY